jgi:hypothetical protein
MHVNAKNSSEFAQISSLRRPRGSFKAISCHGTLRACLSERLAASSSVSRANGIGGLVFMMPRELPAVLVERPPDPCDWRGHEAGRTPTAAILAWPRTQFAVPLLAKPARRQTVL